MNIDWIDLTIYVVFFVLNTRGFFKGYEAHDRFRVVLGFIGFSVCIWGIMRTLGII